MSKIKPNERGYLTIETIISLSFFTLAIIFVYTQVKIIIAENIMQNAVNNMAKEVSAYVYVLDKLGMILDHDDDKNKDVNALVSDANGAIGNVVDFTNQLFSGDGSSADDMADSLSQFVDALRSDKEKLIEDIDNLDKEDLKNLGITAGENAVKGLANVVLSKYFDSRLDRYLPMERSKFCSHFLIDASNDNGKGKFSFSLSRVFPTTECDSVLVAVEYRTKSLIKFIDFRRNICKYAYTGAWVSSSQNHLKKGG